MAGSPLEDSWGVSKAQAIEELEDVEKQLAQSIVAVDDYVDAGWVPHDIAVLQPFVIVDDFTLSRERISPSTPNRAMVHLKHRYVQALLHMKQGLIDAAERDITGLLDDIAVTIVNKL